MRLMTYAKILIDNAFIMKDLGCPVLIYDFESGQPITDRPGMNTECPSL